MSESKESYATPTPFTHEGHSELVLVGGDCVTCHDAETGKELWRAGGWNPQKIGSWRLVPSITGDEKDGLLFACACPRMGRWPPISDGGSGDVTSTRIAWQSNPHATGISSDVCAPLFYKNELFILNGDNKKTLFLSGPADRRQEMVDRSGRQARLPRIADRRTDGKIYCMNESGDVWVVAADNLHQTLSQTSLGGNPSRGSIAVETTGAVVIQVRGRKVVCVQEVRHHSADAQPTFRRLCQGFSRSRRPGGADPASADQSFQLHRPHGAGRVLSRTFKSNSSPDSNPPNAEFYMGLLATAFIVSYPLITASPVFGFGSPTERADG